jgi:hypothetical protein
MKYRKASDVLPAELLKEVQKYVDGEALYFPKYKKRRNWGESTGAQNFYQQRNKEIREKYAQKITIDVLALEYNLSVETIRKIVFDRRIK